MSNSIQNGSHQGNERDGENVNTKTEMVVMMNGRVSSAEIKSILHRSTSQNDKAATSGEEEIRYPVVMSSNTELDPEKKEEVNSGNFIQVFRKKRCIEKFVFMVSVVSLIFLAHAVVNMQWLVPYYYAVSTPILIIIRLAMYWKLKYQLFLLDFCYFGNTMCLIYMWAVPAYVEVFITVFSMSNGPLAWGALMFRNSLVFHSTDKMTSVYIHVLPVYLTYGIRWFPTIVSKYWYTSFVSTFDDPSFIWLLAVPLGCYILHTLLYFIIIHVVVQPADDYLDSYRHLSTNGGIVYKAINICGPKPSQVLYYVFNILFSACTLSLTWILYQYFIAHSIFLGLLTLAVAWNGASFYVDVFSKRGFQAE